MTGVDVDTRVTGKTRVPKVTKNVRTLNVRTPVCKEPWL